MFEPRKESGWLSGMKLEFYPSNLGLPPARVKPQKKNKLKKLSKPT